MRVFLKLAVVVLLVSLTAGGKGRNKSKALLGADNVDKLAAQLNSEPLDEPKTLKQVKQLTKQDKQQLRDMQNRLKTLKAALQDSNKSKADKKDLKQQFRTLKTELHAKRNEYNHLKQMRNEMKHNKLTQKKPKREGKGNRKNKGNVMVDRTTAAPTTTKATTTTTEATTTTTTRATTPAPIITTTVKLTKAQRKALKREGRKGKKNKNKNKGKESLDMLMQADAPINAHPLISKARSNVPGKHHRQRCSSNADCKNGAKCRQNKKGLKFCRGGFNDRVAGKKCHSSEQCARGLMCFVKQTPEQMKHKKHPRRGKGVCSDPKTTDSSKGKFIPFR